MISSDSDGEENNLEQLAGESNNLATENHEAVLANNGNKNQLLRRSGRIRTPSKKREFFESFGSGQKSRGKNTVKRNDNNDESDNEFFEDNDDEPSFSLHDQMNRILEDYGDVAGSEIYKFRTPKKRDAMANLAANTPKTPKTPKTKKTPKTIKTPVSDLKLLSLSTPKRNRNCRNNVEVDTQSLKTPKQTRQKIKQALRDRITSEEESEVTDDEDADYIPDASDKSEEDCAADDKSNSERTTESEEEEDGKSRHYRKTKATFRNLKMVQAYPDESVSLNVKRSTRSRGRLLEQKDYLPESDKYFNQISSKKTSDHTMDRLKSSRLQHEDLFEILRSIKLSEEHRSKTCELNEGHQAHFSKWMLLLNKGFNVILYGLGSKQQILQSFCEIELSDHPLVIVNGFFPTLTVKEILHSIRTDILKTNLNGRTEHEIIDGIADAFRSVPNLHLFIIIHSIDGPMLRKTRDQHLLSRLAKIKNIHLIASIDHINAPLMWDQTCLSNYNFLWWDCTTLLPYTNETAFENSIFLQNSGELSMAAMNNVFQSLTSNARGIYMLMVENQLKSKKDSNYQGISMKDLYHGCRDKFLVSSDLALRTQLTEFVDHNMVKLKRSIDGTEYVTVPIDEYVLQQFFEQQKE